MALRAREALETSVGLGFGDPGLGRCGGLLAVALGAVGVALVVAGGERARAGRWALASAAVMLGVRLVAGLSFVPGLFVATPFAVVGLALAWRRAEWRAAATAALVALPVVWWFQYTGGAAARWAGRYVLLTGLVLGVIGIVAAEEHVPRRLVVGFTVAAIAVTAVGTSWLVVRSHRVADAFATLEADGAPLVSTRAFLLSEGGASYHVERPWLTAIPDDSAAWEAVAAALDARGADRARVVDGPGTADDPPAAPLPGWHRTGSSTSPGCWATTSV